MAAYTLAYSPCPNDTYIFGALTNVAPSHLLDRSLFDFANIEATGEPEPKTIHLAPRRTRSAT